ncbi:hypothetical protein GJ496_008553 [Pomphorhynchus laevis]|nr:hypothetical protein GJ496_008553 [Pomphorhynchus laevis]
MNKVSIRLVGIINYIDPISTRTAGFCYNDLNDNACFSYSKPLLKNILAKYFELNPRAIRILDFHGNELIWHTWPNQFNRLYNIFIKKSKINNSSLISKCAVRFRELKIENKHSSNTQSIYLNENFNTTAFLALFILAVSLILSLLVVIGYYVNRTTKQLQRKSYKIGKFCGGSNEETAFVTLGTPVILSNELNPTIIPNTRMSSCRHKEEHNAIYASSRNCL